MQNLKLPTKLPITAFVASHNEGHLLKRCLSGLSFCSEIIVINLASTDNTIVVARDFEVKILNYPKYPIVEQALHRAIPNALYDWILIIDPDESIGTELIKTIIDLFKNNTLAYHAIRVPVQFYFKDRALKGTIWGGDKDWRLLFNRHYITTSEIVHQGIQVDEKVKTLFIKRSTPNTVIYHFWMTSYKSLFEKHNRYIKQEGKRLYDNGVRYSAKKHFKTTVNAFRNCLFSAKGYKDGLTGLFLSFFWAYYNFKSWSNLLLYTRELNKNK